MFTGIIEHVGTVERIDSTPTGKRLSLDLGPLTETLSPGDSVAVNGACLTASDIGGPVADFDVVTETLSCTTLGRLQPGSKVNLERALPASGRLDGHLVQGHVDGIARVDRIDRAGGQWKIFFQASAELTDQMVAKGSVAIAGVSLTLVDVDSAGFSVALIPTTLGQTALAELSPGQEVNIETDLIGKYVRKFLQAGVGNQGISMQKLRDAGFA